MPSPRKASAPAPKPPRSAVKKPARRKGTVTLEAVMKEVDSPKIREMEKKAAKRRGFKWALGLIIVICFLALLKITVQEAILKNPQFALRDVAVQTSGPLTVQKIVRASQLTQGENLLGINMRALHARLRQLPQVKDVAIERDFDAGLMTLRITQRQPVAWLECAAQGMIPGRPEVGYFVDAGAVPFPCDSLNETWQALPVIRYPALARKSPGVALEDLQLNAALKLLGKLEERFDAGHQQVKIIEIQTPYAMQAVFADRSVITFGVDDLELQLARLDRIRIEARQRQWEIENLNLLVRQNIPVTFRKPPDLTGLQPEAAASVPVSVSLTQSTPVR